MLSYPGIELWRIERKVEIVTPTSSNRRRDNAWVDEALLLLDGYGVTVIAGLTSAVCPRILRMEKETKAGFWRRFGIQSSQSNEPRAKAIRFASSLLYVDLTDGRTIVVSYERLLRLQEATSTQRDNWRLIDHGLTIHWPDVHQELSVRWLLRDAISILPARDQP